MDLALIRDGLLALLPPGGRVVVGVSGGADSIALLHLLARLGYAPLAAHLDHAARPGSADDAAWLAARCAEWGLPLVAARRPVAPGAGFEARARDARLAFLLEVARAEGCGVVALAHQREDQAETVLFRLARGSGPDGLAGMAADRPLAADVRLIRPLLGVPRLALRELLAAWGICWREDPSNADPRHARNRVRHEVLPALERVHPGATEHVAALAELIRAETATWQEPIARIANLIMAEVAPHIGEIDRAAFQGLPYVTRARLVRLLARRLGHPPPGARGLARVLEVATKGGAADLDGGWRVEAAGAWLVVRREPSEGREWDVIETGEQVTAGWGWRITAGSRGERPESACLVRWDLEAMPDGLVWRSARPYADRFTPQGRARAHSLAHWLGRRGVPRHRQEALLVLAAGDEVYWAVGYGRTALAACASDRAPCWEMQATARFRV